MASTRNGSQ